VRESRAESGPWAAASWEGAESSALAAGARLSLADRLRWLEQASAVARELAAASGSAPSAAGFDASHAATAGAVAEPSASLETTPDPSALSLLELLDRLGGASLAGRWSDATLTAALIEVGHGQRVLVIERTYRGGIRVLPDPSADELESARSLRLWDLWNSERARLLFGAI
jgi:hypothetical protein